MNTAPTIPAHPARDFRTRRPALAERARAWFKPLAVVLIAAAMPAFTANSAIFATRSETPQAPIAMPFETAGESFPGSAFYYLEDVPQLVQTGTRQTVQVIGQSTLASASLADVPLAARPLRIVGSGRDHVRAQECMTQAIYYEAASESDAGQRAVAQVVLNRVAHAAYPRSVCGVVYQGSERSTGCQFSFTCDGSLARRPSQTAWSRASRIAREALAGVVYAPVGTATHYHTLAVHPYWAPSLDTVTVIGAHIFYRWKGAAGQPSAFRAGYSGGEPAPGRSRNLTPAAPDPLLAPPTIDLANSPALTPRAAETAFAPAPSSAAPSAANQSIPDPAGDVMPGSGAVRSEYANAGRWIARPGG